MEMVDEIVHLLRDNHMRGDKKSLTFNELMGLLKVRRIANTKQEWIETIGLAEHPLIECTSVSDEARRYRYKSPLPCTTATGLLAYLRNKAMKNQGGTLESEILDSVSDGAAAMTKLGNRIYITEIAKNVKVVFYDKSKKVTRKEVEDVNTFRRLWASDTQEEFNDYKVAMKVKEIGSKPVFDPQRADELRRKKQPFSHERKRKRCEESDDDEDSRRD